MSKTVNARAAGAVQPAAVSDGPKPSVYQKLWKVKVQPIGVYIRKKAEGLASAVFEITPRAAGGKGLTVSVAIGDKVVTAKVPTKAKPAVVAKVLETALRNTLPGRLFEVAQLVRAGAAAAVRLRAIID